MPSLHLCPCEKCPHYSTDPPAKYPRKCYYEPQCWKGQLDVLFSMLKLQLKGSVKGLMPLPKQYAPKGATLYCPHCMIETPVINGPVDHPSHTIPIYCSKCNNQISRLKFNTETHALDLDSSFYIKPQPSPEAACT